MPYAAGVANDPQGLPGEPERTGGVAAASVARGATVSTCSYCSGVGWKYIVRRVALRSVASSSGPVRSLARRSCLDCSGTGRMTAS